MIILNYCQEKVLTLGVVSIHLHKCLTKPNDMRNIYFLLIFAFALFSCKKDSNSNSKESLYSITGVAQKGPFTQGSKVTVYELNSNFEQTGKVFTTETSDDFGSFSLKDMLLTSSIVQVEVEGNPYNEIYGTAILGDEVSLSNIVDLKEGLLINVNLLSDLSRQRFKYLVQSGQSFDASKTQAEREVMKAFGLDSFYVSSSEKMDITQSDDASGSLLALSAIFLTIRTQEYTMFLQQLTAKYRADFETDGKLSDTALICPIQAALYVINPDTIKNLLCRYYKKDIASFTKYIDIAKYRFSVNTYPQGPTDVIISDVTGNLLALIKDTCYLPDSIYSIDFSFPAHVYKKVRLTLYNLGTSNLGNQRWYLWSLNGNNWDYVSNSNGQWIYEMKGIGLTSHSGYLNDNDRVFYLLFEDITDSPSKTLVQKWIGFNHP
jgi:hypothetical protein